MAEKGNINGWERIQIGVKTTERLLGKKDYNSAMIKARQTLEYMVKQLAERAAIPQDRDLKTIIDDLYQGHWIDKTTCDHYHKIRIYGNQAVHDGDNTAFNANQAYQLLSQEVYTFTDGYKNPRGRSRGNSSARSSRNTSANRGIPARVASRRRSRKQSFDVYDLLKLLVPVLCIILLFCVIKLVRPRTEEPETTAETVPTTEAMIEPTTEAPVTTAAETQPVIYKTNDVLNVRPQPNTEEARIGQLEEGTEVEVVRTYDDEWTVILYNGQEAYVASRYLTAE